MGTKKFAFAWRTLTAEPLDVGDTSIVTESQALTVRWPNGGWVWNRPTAVYVYRDGQNQRLPIVDVTRLALIALGIAIPLVTFLLRLIAQSGQETVHEQ